MKALFSNGYKFEEEQLNLIKALGYDITIWRDEIHGELKEPLDYEVLVVSGETLNINVLNMEKLKMIQLISAGFDKLPVKSIKDKGIKIANAKGAYSIPIAEFTILKILEIYKKSRNFEELQSKKEWVPNRDLIELYGKTIGIMGTGSIAIEIAKRLKAFGCKVIGLNTSGKDVEHFEKVYKVEHLNNLLEESDIVISTVPRNNHTMHMINKDNLKYMKEQGILINISRGGIIDEIDLMKHLEKDKLMGVVLDVFEKEPLPENSPLWNHPKVYVTPHNSYISENIRDRIFELVYHNLKALMENKEIKNLI